MGQETSPIAPAVAHSGQEVRPPEDPIEMVVNRHEELVVEPSKVVTIVTLETNGVRNEYRRVVHKWGDVFYFKNGLPCTAMVYQTEAMGPDRLASAGK